MKTQKARTYARNRTKSSEFFSRKGRERYYEKDGVFFAKLALFLVVSAFWLRLAHPLEVAGLQIQAVPLGLVIGLLLVAGIEKYQFNRKIWYVMMIMMTIFTSFTPVGIVL